MRAIVFAIVAARFLESVLPLRPQPRSVWAPYPPAQMTEAQKKAVADFTKVRPDGPFGFWWGYLRVPEVMIPFLRSRRTFTASWKPKKARWARSSRTSRC